MTYLGTSLSPEEYYVRNSASYRNPHEAAIRCAVEHYVKSFSGRVLDLGCGPGLATSALSGLGLRDFVGVDSSPVMAGRYREETGFPACEANFWDELPKADCAVATHSLHLCPSSRLPAAVWRLVEAGVKTLVVVSPLKSILDYIPFCGFRVGWQGPCVFRHGPAGKSIWAKRFQLP